MSKNPETIAELVSGLLSRRPLTGFEIARALESKHRIEVRGSEGEVYVALLQMERDGWIEGVKGEDGRRRYALPVLIDESAPRQGGTGG